MVIISTIKVASCRVVLGSLGKRRKERQSNSWGVLEAYTAPNSLSRPGWLVAFFPLPPSLPPTPPLPAECSSYGQVAWAALTRGGISITLCFHVLSQRLPFPWASATVSIGVSLGPLVIKACRPSSLCRRHQHFLVWRRLPAIVHLLDSTGVTKFCLSSVKSGSGKMVLFDLKMIGSYPKCLFSVRRKLMRTPNCPLASLEAPADILGSRGRRREPFTCSFSTGTDIGAQSCPNISERIDMILVGSGVGLGFMEGGKVGPNWADQCRDLSS